MRFIYFIALSALHFCNSIGFSQSFKFEPIDIDTSQMDENDYEVFYKYRELFESEKNQITRLELYFDFLMEYYDESNWHAFNLRFLEMTENAVKNSKGNVEEDARYYLGQAYNNEGFVQDHYGKPELALYFYKQALHQYELISAEEEKGITYNNIAYSYQSIGKVDSALFFMRLSKNLVKQNEDRSDYAVALNNEAYMLELKGENILALLKYDSALSIQEEMNAIEDIGTTLNNMALIYGGFGDSSKQLEYLLRAKTIADSIGDDLGLITAYTTLGEYYLDHHQSKKAIGYLRNALAKSKAIGSVEDEALIYVHLSRYFLEQKATDSAMKYIQLSTELGEEIGYIGAQGMAMVFLADCYLLLNDLQNAQKAALKAKTIGIEGDDQNVLRNAIERLIEINELMGNYELAYQYKDDLEEIKSIESELEGQRTLLNLDFNRQVELINKNDSLARALMRQKAEVEINSVRQQRWLLGGGLGISLLAIWFIYGAYRRKKRDREIIFKQKEEVSQQRDIANKNYELAETRRAQVEQKNEEILDSILYARRLQEAVLPPQKLVKEWLTSSFILYKPKDIVSGDFYWMETAEYEHDGKKGNLIFFAVADCTGHGVPGAMVSVICAGSLNRAVNEFDLTDVGEILNKVSELIMESFKQSESDIYDGMDIALCALDLGKKQLFYTGANNPLWIITDQEKLNTSITTRLYQSEAIPNLFLHEVKGQRRAVGRHDSDEKFESKLIQLVPGDAVYVFSDGYVDQFGGESGKKFKSKRLKELLLLNANQSMHDQKELLDKTIEEWKGAVEQIDDICILGVKVNGKERANFTSRELEVLEYLREGLPSKLIADKMNISSHTVDTYRRRLLAKTNSYNSTELLQYAKNKEII